MKRILSFIICFVMTIGLFAENNPHRSDVMWVTTPSHTNWLYKLNEEAKITVSVYLYGILQDDIKISYKIGSEMLPPDTEGSAILKNGKAEIEIGTMTSPGFRDCQLIAEFDGKKYKHHIKLGFEPDKLEPYTKYPKDFEQYWKDAMSEADKCPMLVEKAPVPVYSSDKVDCYLVKLQAYKKDQFIYGYLTIPKQEGKFPVVLSPPGAGVKPMDTLKHLFYAESGMIRFDMEIHGIRPDLDKETYKEISRAFGNGNNSYLVNGLDNRDSYYMKKAYLSCIRAIDFLTTLPEWDGENVIVQGGSQGGALALVTAGLDSRVTACAANHPALSDMAGYNAGRAGGYPHLATKFDGMYTSEKLKTLEYYDVVNFAQLIKVPVFMTWGYNDNTCPPTTSYIIYNILKAEKTSLITPATEHWVSTDTRYRILDWIKENLK